MYRQQFPNQVLLVTQEMDGTRNSEILGPGTAGQEKVNHFAKTKRLTA
jgi:hypothetical protein